MVGSIIAADLASEERFLVTLADRSPEALARVRARCEKVHTLEADLSDPARITELASQADLVCGALASHLGFAALGAVIEAGKPYCDISFMPEDALELSARAEAAGVTAIVDCGVAPGMSNLLAAWGASKLDECTHIEILVGGLPVVRSQPWEYKAGFAPADVIEEYTRPARFVVNGAPVVREALSEIEHVEFEGLGTLEAFNTDGLRSLMDTLEVPNMIEKTMRYPGHAERMRTLREAGFFSQEAVEVNGQSVTPLSLTSKLLFRDWAYAPGEEDMTVMRIRARGTKAGNPTEYRWDLADRYSKEQQATSMSRTTALPCAIAARWLLDGEFAKPGVHAPEVLATGGLPERMLQELEKRGVSYSHHEA